MRFKTLAVGLAAVLAFSCGESTPTELASEPGSPVSSQGGANAGDHPYSITVLPNIPGTNSCQANDITDQGVVIGSCEGDGGPVPNIGFTQGVVWDRGEVIVLPSLGGFQTVAAGINARGWIVGTAQTPPKSENDIGDAHAVLWTDYNTIVDLGASLTGPNSYGTDVNASGHVALRECETLFLCRGIIWYRGSTTDIGDLGGGVTVIGGINDKGQVVGNSSIGSGESHAYLWERGQMRDLGTFGGGFSRAFGLNNGGQIVGESRLPSFEVHAFRWVRGETSDLGVPGTYITRALDINGAGIVVGNTFELGVGVRAVVWHDGALTNLGAIWNTSSSANAINSHGQIAGRAVTPDWSGQRAVVWER